MSNDGGSEFGAGQPVDRRVERPTFQTEWPLVRSLDAGGMLSVLNNRTPLNSTEMSNTYFWCTSPELPLVSKTYADGTDDIGAFVIFPREANSMRPELAVGNTDMLFQVTIPSDSVIDYAAYLFVRPQDWDSIGSCHSIEEARQRLTELGVDQSEVQNEAAGKLEELIEMRKEIIDFLLTPSNPLVTNEVLWDEFERRFVYNRMSESESDWVNAVIKENLSYYRGLLVEEGSREEKEGELRERQVFDPYILTANYAESQAILAFLRSA